MLTTDDRLGAGPAGLHRRRRRPALVWPGLDSAARRRRRPGVGARRARAGVRAPPAGCRRSRRAAAAEPVLGGAGGLAALGAGLDARSSSPRAGRCARSRSRPRAVTTPLAGRRAARAGRLAAMRRGRHAELRVGRAAALQRARGDRLDAGRRADRPAGAAVHRPGRAPADADVVKDAGSRDALRPALHAGARLLGPGHGRATASATASWSPRSTASPSSSSRARRAGRASRPRDRPCSSQARAVPERERDAAAGPQAARRWSRVSCDQDCSLAVRLTATLRTRKTFTGPQVRRTLAAKQVVRLRLRLPDQAARDAEDGVDHRARAQRRRRRPAA